MPGVTSGLVKCGSACGIRRSLARKLAASALAPAATLRFLLALVMESPCYPLAGIPVLPALRKKPPGRDPVAAEVRRESEKATGAAFAIHAPLREPAVAIAASSRQAAHSPSNSALEM